MYEYVCIRKKKKKKIIRFLIPQKKLGKDTTCTRYDVRYDLKNLIDQFLL